MALRNITVRGEEILARKCKPVKEMTPRTEELIDDMFETMYAANGVGLAAPQVGVLKRIVVIDVMDGSPLVLINPEIVEEDGEQTGSEGCLSLPGLEGEVTRPNHVVCKALDRNMQEITVEGTELLARAICHELDHLDGVLYKDKVNDGLHRVQPMDPDDLDDEEFDDEFEDEE